MIRGENIYLRMLEPEDWELTYKWHNDYEIQKMTCGPIRIVSKEIERAWVNAKSNSNRSDLYLAICLNENDKMIGFMSLNDINHHFSSCHWGGIVIGDKNYRDGVEYIEASLLLLHYAFDQLNMHRVTGACLKEHIISRSQMPALFFQHEGIQRDAVRKNGRYYDVFTYSILCDDYYNHLSANDYELQAIIMRIVAIAKSIKKEMLKK